MWRGVNIAKRLTVLYLALFLIGSAAASLDVQLSDQGTGVVSASGDLQSGDIGVLIYDAPAAGNLVYNETFTGAIVNGSWNVMLGDGVNLSLEMNKIYYKDYMILGENASFGGADRQVFYSSLGDINSEDLVSRINISVGNITFENSNETLFANSTSIFYYNGTDYIDLTTSGDIGAWVHNDTTNITSLVNTQDNVEISNNLTVTGFGFFSWIGSFVNQVTRLFVEDINFNGTINGTGNIVTTGNVTVGDELSVADKIIIINQTGVVDTTNSIANTNGTLYWSGTALCLEDGSNCQAAISNIWVGSNDSFVKLNSNMSGHLNVSNIFFVNGSNVGIGTSTPSYLLDISGDMRVGPALFVNYSSFRVGIGTTDPEFPLEIESASGYGWGYTGGSSTLAVRMFGGGPSLGTTTDDDLRFFTNSSGAANNRMIITNIGDVGIGTESPSMKLEVDGSTKVTDNLTVGDTIVIINQTDVINTANSIANTNGTLYWSGIALCLEDGSNCQAAISNIWVGSNDSFVRLNANMSGHLNVSNIFFVNGSNVGIGTSTPGELLDVSGNMSVDDGTLFVNSVLHYVGIGTTTPTLPLDIYTMAGGFGFGQTDGTRTIASRIVAGRPAFGTATNHSLDFFVNGMPAENTHMTIDTSGYVGIGTKSPSAKLEVDGSVKVTDNLTVGDTIIIINQTGIINTTNSIANTNGTLYWSGTALCLEGGTNCQAAISNVWVGSNDSFVRLNSNMSGHLNVSDVLFVNGSRVGIGTSTPSQLLEVNGNMSVGNGVLFVNTEMDWVGIGTSSPILPLHVYTPAGGVGFGQTDGTRVLITQINAGRPAFGTPLNDSLDFFTNGTSASDVHLTITNTGLIGVGTKAPSTKFEVNGTAKVTDSLTLDADLQFADENHTISANDTSIYYYNGSDYIDLTRSGDVGVWTHNDITNITSLTNAQDNVNIANNLTVTSSGFFSLVGSLLNRVTGLFVEDINFNGTLIGGEVNISAITGNIVTNGNVTVGGLLEFNDENHTISANDTSIYYYNGTTYIDLTSSGDVAVWTHNDTTNITSLVNIQDDVELSGDLNMTSNNITVVDCITFISGGRICNSP